MTERVDFSKLTDASRAHPLAGDDVRLTVRRLGVASAVAAAAHLVYLVLYRTWWSSEANVVGLSAGIAGVVVSVAVSAYLLLGDPGAKRVVATGIAYEVFLAFDLAVSESWAVDYTAPSAQVPWAALIIVLFPFLIPTRPRVILAASLLAAATTPGALALMVAVTGRPWPPAAVIASHVLPLFVGAVLAWLPANTLYRLRADVHRARRLGSYELIERLGEGGMGEVWRASHRLLARPAAVKIIKPEMLGARDAASRELLLRRFEKEAQVTASLESPHSVELYDFGVSSDGALFYVMELLRGLDLETLVQRFGPLEPERVVYLLVQVCDSLEDAHERGLIHRDVKPANLFVARKGTAFDFMKVLDFGLVKQWAADEDSTLGSPLRGTEPGGTKQTAAGQIVGTPAFLAPESALGEQVIDPRVDVYAVGCVAYWMLTGMTVFDESTALKMAVAQVSRAPDPPSSRLGRPLIPELERTVMSCLEKDRARRPASARALRDRLCEVPLAHPWTTARAAEWWRQHGSASRT